MHVDIENREFFEEAEMPEQKTQTFRGTVENVKNVNTRSGRKMITFEMAGYPFKAFGEQADAIEQVEGQHVEITAKHNTFHGKDEYAVVTIAGEIEGQRVKASDTRRSVLASSSQSQVPAPQQNLKHGDRDHCRLSSYGRDLKAREVGAWLNEFIDSLTENEWRQWKTHWDNRWPHTNVENDKIAEIDEKIKVAEEKNHGPYNVESMDKLLNLWNERNNVVVHGGGLESVKARFNARLDLVGEDLRRKVTAQVSKADFTPINDSAPKLSINAGAAMNGDRGS
jgi:hypothetical protein